MKKYLSILLIFFLLFGFASPAFAVGVIDLPDDIPLPTNADILNAYRSADYENLPFPGDYDFLVYYLDFQDSWYCKVIFDNSSNFYLYENSRFLVTDYTDPWDWLTILKYNSGVWSYYGSSSLAGGSITVDGVLYGNMNITAGAQVAYSTRTIYYFGSDEVFFYQSPTLTEATGEALVQFQNQITQTIMIILLCGVGCLALLISLPLLKRVFLQFLNR